jgi:hypothetical protein
MFSAKAIYCIGTTALALFVGIGVFISAHTSALWVRYSWLLIAILAVPHGCLCFLHEHYRTSLPYRTRAYLDHYDTLLVGIIMGVIITLGIYGLVGLVTRKHREV